MIRLLVFKVCKHLFSIGCKQANNGVKSCFVKNTTGKEKTLEFGFTPIKRWTIFKMFVVSAKIPLTECFTKWSSCHVAKSSSTLGIKKLFLKNIPTIILIAHSQYTKTGAKTNQSLLDRCTDVGYKRSSNLAMLSKATQAGTLMHHYALQTFNSQIGWTFPIRIKILYDTTN